MENTSRVKTDYEQDKMGASLKAQEKAEHKEGPVARAIENQTAKVPSDVFLWMAGASVIGSAALKVMELVKSPAKERGRALSVFVGMWAPTFLMLGLYNKVVKVAGSDRTSRKS